MRRLAPRGAERRGAVLPLVCILLVVLLGAGAIGIDLARLYYAGAEAQTAADAAALAAARAKQYNPIDWPQNATANAIAAARDAASRNQAGGAPATVADADVQPVAYDPATRAVTASYWNSETSAVQVTAEARPTYVLGGVFGRAAPAVRRTASAWLANVNGANCVRPIAIDYTRFYEEGVTYDFRYSSVGAKAPEFNFWDIASTQYAPLAGRTFIVLPPGAKRADWQSRTPPSGSNRGAYTGFNSHGNWQPVDYNGGGLWGFAYALGGPEGTAYCTGNRAAVGDMLPALRADSASIIQFANGAMIYLCNRAGNAPNAYCYNANGTVGVKTRIMLTDSVLVNGVWTHQVREVGVARIMCYFQSSSDICADLPMNERAATGTWNYYGPTSGYPPGTVIVFLDTPGSTQITRDVVLGNKPGLTQRLLLIK